MIKSLVTSQHTGTYYLSGEFYFSYLFSIQITGMLDAHSARFKWVLSLLDIDV
jgi:hypothetical protein